MKPRAITVSYKWRQAVFGECRRGYQVLSGSHNAMVEL